MPERTWRRWQGRDRAGAATKGPWPRPARDRVRDAARRHALARPAWGHRKIWAMCRHEGLRVSQAGVLRLLRDEGLNTIRPHEALSWNRPVEVHTGLADPRVPNLPEPEILPTA